MLKFNKQEAEIFINKDGEKLFVELSVEGKKINSSNEGFLFDVAKHENQHLKCIIDGKFLLCKGKIIKEYESIFDKDTILDLIIENGTGKIVLGNCVLDSFPCDLKRKHYKVNVQSDENYTIVRYANLHQHTENSLLDGITRIKDLAKKSEYACAITDHGNMFGSFDMKQVFDKAHKKAIIGEEFYIETFGGPREILPKDVKTIDEDSLMFDNVKEQNPNGLNGEHLIVLAKNNTGIKNLYALSSNASLHFYRKPHITFEELKKHKEGLIVSSACIAGGLGQFIKEYLKAKEFDEVNEWIENYGEFFYNEPEYNEDQPLPVKVYVYNHRKARELIEWFVREFKEDFYLEYQDHHFPVEKAIMKELVRIRDEEYPDIKIIATCDAHYLNKEDAYVHELFLCNQTKKTIDDPKHMKFSGDGYYVHTSKEMLELFPEEYLDNTLEIEEKVNYEELPKAYHLPKFPLPEGFENEADYFKHLCVKGFNEKFKHLDKETKSIYQKRLAEEGRTIKQMGWPSYFLIVQDFIKWAEDTDVKSHWQDYFPNRKFEEIPTELLKDYSIYIGSGRGSGAGSLINYCLGITKVDPLIYDLKFERFLNPDRISMPDIDTDLEDVNRGKVLDYVRFKYGKKNVANIITFGTAAAKNSIKTINRVLGGSVANGDNIAKYIPEKPGITIAQALEDKDFKDLYNSSAEARKIIDLAQKIEGLKTSQSIHPCGVLITDEEVVNYMPEVQLEDPDTKEKVWVTQMEGPTCEELGCLKMDFLGLRTLGYVHETIDSIKRNTGRDIDYEKIPLDDIEVYKHIAKGNTASMFQIESDMFTTTIRKILKDILQKDNKTDGKECFNRLIAMNALVRPGSNIFIDDFADRTIHPELITYLVPELEPILKETYGIILYQEQTMRIARDLAGFSAGQADTVRKAMGKKKKYIMDEYKDYFIHGNKKMKIEGCVVKGISEKKASELWDIMALASSYSFNKSHAVAYSIHSIRTAWLAYYYPYEYLTAVLNSFSTDTERLSKYLDVARKQKMQILPPSINKSHKGFTTDGKAIQVGFSGIKGINAVAQDLINERENGEFKNFEDFLERMSYYKNFSKRTLESLVYAGMLDGYYGSRLCKINQLEAISAYVKKLKDYRKKLNDGKVHRKLEKPILALESYDDEIDKLELLLKEKTYTGMYISGNPMDLFKDYIKNSYDCSNIKKGNGIVCGIVQEVERKISKKGNTFYTFKLENNGIISGIMSSRNGETIADNEVVRLIGKISINEYGANISVDSKEDLSLYREICEKQKDIEVLIENEDVKDRFKKIIFPKGKRTIKASYKGKIREFKDIQITPSVAGKLIEIIGIENIKC